MADIHNDNLKKTLSAALRKTDVNIDGINIPLLNKNTEQIILNCHGGSVVDVKPLLKFK